MLDDMVEGFDVVFHIGLTELGQRLDLVETLVDVGLIENTGVDLRIG